MKITSIIAFLSLVLCCISIANADIFGSGANSFDIDFVTIGNPGNADDTTGSPNPAGKVDYGYRIGKYEISEQMIDKANTLGGLGITKDTRGPDKPATRVSWFDAAKFVNWLNLETNSTPAYKFDGSGNFQLWAPSDPGYNPNNLYRNRQAKYFLPSMDEWYKAAYYAPNSGVYFNYPTGSDTFPDGIDFAGDTTFDAVFADGGFNPDPNDITDVGILSPYGTAGQGGNVMEWEETDFDLVNDSNLASFFRGVRGGFWFSPRSFLWSLDRGSANPANAANIGFRVASISASIPEPSSLLLGALSSVGVLMRRRRFS